MTDLFDEIEKMQAFGRALQTGVEKSVQALPILARQQVNNKARNKLHTTLDDYMSAIQTDMQDYVFIMEIDRESWLANALEVGVSGFDMRRGLLSGKNAKISKKGHKYAHIPIKKDIHKQSGAMNTQKGQEYQRLIEHVMRKPKFGPSQLKYQHDGTVIESQRLLTDEPKLQGFYRFRKLKSAQQAFGGGRGIPFHHVMFRTISEKGSKTGAAWQHPGLEPVHILRDLQHELPQIFETLLEGIINNELNKL